MQDSLIRIRPLGMPWETPDPFLFCVHHNDAYPKGNAQLAPAAPLSGRTLGNDFAGRDGWNMYHGQTVPGFPYHPHRGFETVTIVRRGYVDHSDSLGATARFGGGDVQWLTAGRGIQHSEMFPLLREDRENPLELFQIWLNLPARDKLVPPHFAMLWNEDLHPVVTADREGRATTVVPIAGRFEGVTPPAPPPHSWAADPEHEVAIWTIRMSVGAHWTLPPAGADTQRTLYFFAGDSVELDGRRIDTHAALWLRPDHAAALVNGPTEAEFLLLQGRPLAEPVAQHGPFVMNYQGEIRQAFVEYQQTQFGGWPWSRPDPVHAHERGRFAIHADGRVEEREMPKAG